MSDSPFTNREIKTMLQSIKDILNEHTDVHVQILEQAKKTNGRVSRLEIWQAKLEGAGSAIKVGWGIIGIFIIAASFSIFRMYVQFQSIDVRINEAIATQLDDYEVELVK